MTIKWWEAFENEDFIRRQGGGSHQGSCELIHKWQSPTGKKRNLTLGACGGGHKRFVNLKEVHINKSTQDRSELNGTEVSRLCKKYVWGFESEVPLSTKFIDFTLSLSNLSFGFMYEMEHTGSLERRTMNVAD
eukprot:scaffold166194_cov14-Tisochrysis_lutea.AAC.1